MKKMIFTIFTAFALIGCNVVDIEPNDEPYVDTTEVIDTSFVDTVEIPDTTSKDTVKIDTVASIDTTKIDTIICESTPMLTYFVRHDSVIIRLNKIFKFDDIIDSVLVINFSLVVEPRENNKYYIEYAIDKTWLINEMKNSYEVFLRFYSTEDAYSESGIIRSDYPKFIK